MVTTTRTNTTPRRTKAPTAPTKPRRALPGQVVLVLQGGGALGAYQVGVYQALHQAGIEPDWVIGTSIGAVNAAIIAGNAPAQRFERLNALWDQWQQPGELTQPLGWLGLGGVLNNFNTVVHGIPAFFTPNPAALRGATASVGVEAASYYSAEPLRDTLHALVDFDYLRDCHTRLTVGAVNALTGSMRYFDSRAEPLNADHILASGALPPAFGAVRIEGQPYWDGGIYSNTPIEAVLDDKPRRDSLIFAVNVWHQSGPEPESIWQVMARQKDIQYASRADSHIARQKQIHHLRHIIRELYRQLPQARQADAKAKALAGWGCGTVMHVAHMLAPRLPQEDQTKDIDFSPAGVQARRQAGFDDTVRMLNRAPWEQPVDPSEGVIEHRSDADAP
jgi:NTE family protein